MLDMAYDQTSAHNQLRIFFVPFPTAGHMIPMVDAARAFARHGGVHVTIVATAAAALSFSDSLSADSTAGHPIAIHTLPFPAADVGLPAGVETLSAVAATRETWGAVHRGFGLLRGPMERLFRETRPDCIVSDMFLPWTADAAAELGVPRLVFRSSGYFEQCALHGLRRFYGGDGDASADVIPLPELPGKIEFLKSQVPDWIITPNEYTRLMDAIAESERRSYGVVFNTFRDMESPYEDYFRTALGMKSWSIGPSALRWINPKMISEWHDHEVLKWLDSKEPDSVLYVAFGSLTKLSGAQLGEVARGLEECGHPFVWVVRRENIGGDALALPEGFEERGKGFLVKGWAPQAEILRHRAVGGMVTHCGWNSATEALSAGVAVVTWPMFAEQFYNEKLLTEVLGVGVAVGATEWRPDGLGEAAAVVAAERVREAAAALMGDGAEAAERRVRARRLAEAARKAVESGGSSDVNMMGLIDELKCLKSQREDI